MDATAGVTYAFLIIPLMFAGVVAIQGFEKLKNNDKEGYVGIGFGVFFLIIIVAAYFLFIR